jgi:bacteriorhodopsin
MKLFDAMGSMGMVLVVALASAVPAALLHKWFGWSWTLAGFCGTLIVFAIIVSAGAAASFRRRK